MNMYYHWKFEIPDQVHEGFEDIPACELAVGDEITHLVFGPGDVSQVDSDSMTKECTHWLVTEVTKTTVYGCDVYSDGSKSAPNGITRLNSKTKFRVRLKNEVQSDPSRWNGKCPTCGRNTYTGFNAVEHDGICR